MIQKKMRTMQLLVLLSAVLGWLIGLASAITGDTVRRQNVLVEQARGYEKDMLYMQAVRFYKQALSDYNTRQNFDIETELLSVYQEAGKMDAYYGLAEERIENGTALEEEYETLAGYYIAQGRENMAIPVLQQGIGRYGSDSLNQLYESVCYELEGLKTAYSVLGMPSDNGLILAFDGEAFGYINEEGRGVLDFAYEEAFPFSGGYAVVKQDGVYILIDVQGDWYGIDKAGLEEVTAYAGNLLVGKKQGKCGLYTSTFERITEHVFEDVILSANGLCFVKLNGKWGLINSSGKQIIDYIYEDISKNSRGEAFVNGYAVVKDEKGYFLIDSSGNAVFDARFINAKGIEGGYYAVADASGMWGFADRTGAVVIGYQFEDAFSFSDSLAAVKYGDEWGYINENGTMVIEEQFEEAYPFRNGKTLARELGYFQILKLKYYDVYNTDKR